MLMYIERNQTELEKKIQEEAASFAAWCEDNLRIGLEDFLASQGSDDNGNRDN